MPLDPSLLQRTFTQAEQLYDQQAVLAAIERMASEINRHFAKRYPIVLTVMVGGMVLTGQLLPKLHFPLQLDYVHVTRYRGQTAGGELQWKATPSLSLLGRDVLIIDDILDAGHTLAAVRDDCLQRGAISVEIAVLVDKPQARQESINADFVGLTVAPRYVFGYGMDYQEGLRNAPGIYAVSASTGERNA